MKLEKAIEITGIIVKTGEYKGSPDDEDALKVLIEAGKAWQFMRTHSGMSFDYYLPGETED